MSHLTELYATPFFKVVQDVKYFVIHERATENGVVVAAQREDGRFLLARLFRQAIGGFSLEFPRGAIDAGESAIEAGRREAMEETSFFCKGVMHLGRMHSNTSLLHSHVVLVHAEVDTTMQMATDGEVESIQWVTRSELDHLILSGVITDSHTLAAYLKLKLMAEA